MCKTDSPGSGETASNHRAWTEGWPLLIWRAGSIATDDVLIDVLEPRVGFRGKGSRRVEWLANMAHLPGWGTEKLLARYSGKSFHDRFHAKMGDGA
jgi:hypothetical protein